MEYINVLSITACRANRNVNQPSGHSHIVRDGDARTLCGKNCELWPMNEVRATAEDASCIICGRAYARILGVSPDSLGHRGLLGRY